MKKTSRSCWLRSIEARAPAWSMAGPLVVLMPTPSSLAMMLARVVLPSPGGPQRRTWSTCSPRRRAAARRAPDGRHVAVQDRPLEHDDAGRAEDGQADLGPHAVHLDQLLEQLQLIRRGKAEQGELVLADVRVHVQLGLAADRAHLL